MVRMQSLRQERRRRPAGFQLERESGRGDGLSLVSWGARFDDPIALANGRKLLTLQDAATHITNLPKKESDLPEWQAPPVDHLHLPRPGWPTLFSRIGGRGALYS